MRATGLAVLSGYHGDVGPVFSRFHDPVCRNLYASVLTVGTLSGWQSLCRVGFLLHLTSTIDTSNSRVTLSMF
jgi:hypothetical protein